MMCVYVSKNIAECQPGYYGKNCTYMCSGNCLHDNNRCDRFTGQCNSGCKPGWTGNICYQRKNKVLFFFLLKRLHVIRIYKIFLQINAIMHNLKRSQFSVYCLRTFCKHFRKILIDCTCIVMLF